MSRCLWRSSCLQASCWMLLLMLVMAEVPKYLDFTFGFLIRVFDLVACWLTTVPSCSWTFVWMRLLIILKMCVVAIFWWRFVIVHILLFMPWMLAVGALLSRLYRFLIALFWSFSMLWICDELTQPQAAIPYWSLLWNIDKNKVRFILWGMPWLIFRNIPAIGASFFLGFWCGFSISCHCRKWVRGIVQMSLFQSVDF